MGLFKNDTARVEPRPRDMVVGAPTPVADVGRQSTRAKYRVVGAWELIVVRDAAGNVVGRYYGDGIDTNINGWCEVEGGRRAGVGEVIELTRGEAEVLGKRFALAPEL
jgi:hypothetical protein